MTWLPRVLRINPKSLPCFQCLEGFGLSSLFSLRMTCNPLLSSDAPCLLKASANIFFHLPARHRLPPPAPHLRFLGLSLRGPYTGSPVKPFILYPSMKLHACHDSRLFFLRFQGSLCLTVHFPVSRSQYEAGTRRG